VSASWIPERERGEIGASVKQTLKNALTLACQSDGTFHFTHFARVQYQLELRRPQSKLLYTRGV